MINLFEKFEKFRTSIINDIYNIVNGNFEKKIELDNEPHYFVNDEKEVIKNVYVRLFIKDKYLYIKYKYANLSDNENMKTDYCPLEYFSCDELYKIIKRIK